MAHAPARTTEPGAPERDERPPEPAPVSPLVGLQRTIGNHAVARLVSSPGSAERELDKKWTVSTDGVDDAQAKEILALKQIAMTFYVEYKGGKDPKNDEHFIHVARDFATTYKTLGVEGTDKDGAKLSLGKSIKADNRGDLVQAISSVAQTVHRIGQARKAPEDGSLLPPPPQINTIAIFAHGENFGLGIDPANSDYFKSDEQIANFVGAIRGAVAGNLHVLLYACSAGGTAEDLEPNKPYAPKGGKGSFAQRLADKLGGQAQVFAHNTAAHTESNPAARRFSAGAGEGEAMFEVLYGDAFVDAEVKRMRDTKTDLVKSYGEDGALREKLKEAMRAHYRDGVATDYFRINTNNRHFKNIGGHGGIGAAMFMDPEGTAKLMQADFKSYWLGDATISNGFVRGGGGPKTSAPAPVARKLMRTEYPPGKEADKAEFWGSPAKHMPPVTMGHNIANHLLSDPKYHDAAAEMLNGWWMVHMVDVCKVIHQPHGKLAALIAAAERKRIFRVTLAAELVRDPENFDAEKHLANAKVTPEERQGLLGVDASGKRLGLDQLAELKTMQGAELARQWPKVMRGPAKDVLKPERRQAILDHVTRERARVGRSLRPELIVTTPPGYHTGLSYSKPKSQIPKEVSPTNYDTADPGDAGNPTRARINRLAWQELLTEGSEASLNAWDPELLTVGRGFGVRSGQGANVLRDAFASDPIARGWMLDVGFTMDGTTALFLNAATGAIVEGDAALHAVEQDKVFGSQFMHVFEEAGHDQEMVNAQLAQMRRMTAGVPDALLAKVGAWSDTTIRWAMHLRHFAPGAWPWERVVATAGDGGDVHVLGLAAIKANAPKVSLPATAGNIAVHIQESSRMMEWAENVMTTKLTEAPATATPVLDRLANLRRSLDSATAAVRAAEKKHEPTEALEQKRTQAQQALETASGAADVTALAGFGYVLDDRPPKRRYFKYGL